MRSYTLCSVNNLVFLKATFFRAMGGDCPGRQFLIVVLKYSQQPVKKPKRLYALKKMDCYVV